jgi:photosystem II stability/assembly factor-like uncharacterized protein
MKKIRITLILTAIGLSSYTQWILQNPYPTTSTLEKVVCINTNSALFFGGDATIMKTADAGSSFNKIITGLDITDYLTSADFPTTDTGYTVSYKGKVFKTTDAGSSWIIACDTLHMALHINCIKFANDLTGYMAGDDNQVFRTTDGGYSWSLQTTSYPIIFHDLYLVSSDTLFAAIMDNAHIVRGGSILKSINKGITWSECYHDLNHRSINAIDFFNAGTGYATGGEGLILRSVFNGMAWDPVPNPAGTNKSLMDLKLTDSQTIVIVGSEGTVMKSTDEGQSWIMDSVTVSELRSVDIMNNIGYATGVDGKLFKTTDNGSSWIVLSKGSTDVLNSVFFVDESVGYAAGGIYSGMKGTILKTTDGGENWTDLNCGISEYLYSVYFTDSNTGFVVGAKGLIVRTTDGGSSWTTVHSSIPDEFHSVCFPDNNTGYVVGGSKILKSANGGSEWLDISPDGDYFLTSAYFIDPNTGFVSGYDYSTFSNLIFKTIDGGQTWPAYTFASQSGLKSIHFADYNYGFTMENGRAYKTTDGGESWVQTLDAGNRELNAVFMSSPDIVYIAADYGDILKTDDGGNTWAESSTSTLNPLNSVFFTDPGTGYTAGLTGNIFKTTNGGGYDEIHDAIISKSGFNLYPNPATTKITLKNTSAFVGETTVIIYTAQGRQVFNHTYKAQDNLELDLSNLSTGIYLLKTQNNAGAEIKKLVIQ